MVIENQENIRVTHILLTLILFQGVGNGIDVKRMMDTWTSQMGFPVVRVTRNPIRPVVRAEQQHFLIYPRSQSSSNSQ